MFLLSVAISIAKHSLLTNVLSVCRTVAVGDCSDIWRPIIWRLLRSRTGAHQFVRSCAPVAASGDHGREGPSGIASSTNRLVGLIRPSGRAATAAATSFTRLSVHQGQWVLTLEGFLCIQRQLLWRQPVSWPSNNNMKIFWILLLFGSTAAEALERGGGLRQLYKR